MSFDGFMTRAITHELSSQITSGRISKIYQPFKTDLVFTIRANRQNFHLLMSVNASFARIHFTNEKYENPAEPPMFCMLLRKHLEGAIIEQIEQLDMERVIVFTIRHKDEIGDETRKKLYIEIMGRHSNISLVDADTEIILDSIKHVGLTQSSIRTILPGQRYIRPPEQNKEDPLMIDETRLLQLLDFNAGKLDKQLVDHLAGLSPMLAKEIIHLAGPFVNKQSISEAFLSLMTQFKNHSYEPEMIMSEKEAFSLIHLKHLNGERKTFKTVSELLDRFFFGKAERDRVKQQAHDLERFMKNEWQKNKKKIKKVRKNVNPSRPSTRISETR